MVQGRIDMDRGRTQFDMDCLTTSTLSDAPFGRWLVCRRGGVASQS